MNVLRKVHGFYFTPVKADNTGHPDAHDVYVADLVAALTGKSHKR